MKNVLITLLTIMIALLCWGIYTGDIRKAPESMELATDSKTSCLVKEGARVCQQVSMRTWIEPLTDGTLPSQ
ncbi:hypothetical protein EZMO1_1472 [Endozoicomonas montiporae CL-33]|nr:hypothetical protein EZMO1_1472 [Endozoicomonas montiporae CL-33]